MTQSTLRKAAHLIRKTSALSACSLAILGLLNASAVERPEFQAGLMTGYSYGQNGFPWPSLLKDPLGNDNRGGFYVSQLRLKGTVAFDSTFSAVAVGNAYFADVQEVYLQKRVDNYIFTFGKFRGAGLKSGSGTDEFERTAVNAPRYANVWGHYKRLLNFRDFGVQAEADYHGGAVKHRLFVHNANRDNVINREPNEEYLQTTQALGVDYALDWRISPYTVWGGHAGALASREWDEFAGNHEGWEAGYWFKTNPVVDASLYHQLDVGRLHLFDEAMILYNRELPNPEDSSATQSWGFSTSARFDHTPRTGYFFRYELFDLSDGYYKDDGRHLITLGGIFHPSPEKYPGLMVTGEYVRVLEEGGENTVGNDLLLCQLQMLF
ncbi:MAG TPA: hypothetical protein VJ385_14760 [Fibrobacteria bacterium]|nr:hypothetical protein [Fibrobacteria bacterium]